MVEDDTSEWTSDMQYDIIHEYPIASNTYERADGTGYYLVGHPHNRSIGHWVAVHGFKNSGSTTHYADSVHGTDHAEVEARATAVVMDDAFGRPAQYDDSNRLIRVEVKSNPEMAWRWLQTRRREEWGQHINIDVRGIAKSVAAEMGLDVEEVLAAAEALLAENR